MRGTLQQRLEEKYIPEPNSGCWIWTGAVTNLGYGKISVARSHWKHAHRISWMIYRGRIPNGKIVCHACDNPSCINPDHLWLGTYKENMADCMSKGRWGYHDSKGEKNPKSILTEKQVRKILRSKLSGRQLSRQYHVGDDVISKIKRGVNWRYLYDEWKANERVMAKL